jgi:drug/metabolite transporter (DMT)-like permease
MPQPSRSLTPGIADYGLLLLVSAIWGSSFMLIKVAVPTLPAMPLTALRLGVAAVVMLGLTAIVGQKVYFSRHNIMWMALVAIFGNALPFALISWGEEAVPASVAAMLMAVVPLTSVLLAHFFTDDEKLNRWKVFGVFFGIAGLIVLIGPGKLARLGEDVMHQLAIAFAAMCYGVTGLFVRRIKGVSQPAMTAGIMTLSAVMMVPFSLYLFPLADLHPSNLAISTGVVLGVVHTATASLLAYVIIQRLGVTFFSQLNFIVPLFGVLFGVLFLAEQPGLQALAALVLILVGVGLARLGILKSVK